MHNVLSAVKPGTIILMHDAGGDRSQTLAALPPIITTLQSQGYTFTTPAAAVVAGTGAGSATIARITEYQRLSPLIDYRAPRGPLQT